MKAPSHTKSLPSRKTGELVRVRRFAQLTLPEEFRERFGVKEGDYIQATMVSRGMMLKPVTIISHDRAWEKILASVKKARPSAKIRAKTPRAQEELITASVKNERKKK